MTQKMMTNSEFLMNDIEVTSTTNVQVEWSFSHLETVTRARMTMNTKYVKMFVPKKESIKHPRRKGFITCGKPNKMPKKMVRRIAD